MKNFTKMIAAMFVAALMSFNVVGQDIDLVQGLNYGYDHVNAQGIVSISSIDVCNNGNDNASAFDVTLYFYDENTQDVYFLDTYRLTNGLSGNACVTIENWDVNINDYPSVPAGTYRFGFWVDANEEISETDETNNAGLLAGNNNYSPSTSNLTELNGVESISVYPNPTSDFIYVEVDSENKIESSISLFNLSGQEVLTIDAADSFASEKVKIDVSNMEEGVYILRFVAKGELFTKKIVVE